MSDTASKLRKELGEYLTKIRTSKKVSKYKIVQEFNLNIHIINAIERGERSYTIDSLFKYASALGIKITFTDDQPIQMLKD